MGPVTLTTGTRAYLDANTFIYAAERPSAFPALMAFLDRVERGEVTAVTSALTLAEVLVLPLRTGDVPLQRLYRTRLTSDAALTVIDVSRDILVRAAAIRADTVGVKLPDAIHVATAVIDGCDVFLTNDVRLRTAAGINVVTLPDLA